MQSKKFQLKFIKKIDKIILFSEFSFKDPSFQKFEKVKEILIALKVKWNRRSKTPIIKLNLKNKSNL